MWDDALYRWKKQYLDSPSGQLSIGFFKDILYIFYGILLYWQSCPKILVSRYGYQKLHISPIDFFIVKWLLVQVVRFFEDQYLIFCKLTCLKKLNHAPSIIKYKTLTPHQRFHVKPVSVIKFFGLSVSFSCCSYVTRYCLKLKKKKYIAARCVFYTTICCDNFHTDFFGFSKILCSIFATVYEVLTESGLFHSVCIIDPVAHHFLTKFWILRFAGIFPLEKLYFLEGSWMNISFDIAILSWRE